MGLREDIGAAVKEAMKAGDKKRLSTLRLMSAAIKDKDINARTDGHDSLLTPDAGLVDLFAKMVKQRQESIAVYLQGGRPELAQHEQDEADQNPAEGAHAGRVSVSRSRHRTGGPRATRGARPSRRRG